MASFDDFTPVGSAIPLGTMTPPPPPGVRPGPDNVVLLADGDIYVPTYGVNDSAYGQLYSAAGTALRPADMLRAPAYVGTYLTAALDGGGFAVAFAYAQFDWLGQNAGIVDVFDASGALIRTIPLDTAYSGPITGLTALSDGGFAVAWDHGARYQGSYWNVETFDAAGNPTSGPDVLNAQTGAVVGAPSGGFVVSSLTYDAGPGFHTTGGPAAQAGTALADGDLVFVWSQAVQVSAFQPPQYQILAQVYDPTANTLLGLPSLIETGAYAVPQVAATPDGGYVVSWRVGDANGYTEARAVGPAGQLGPTIQLAGDVQGLDPNGHLVTVRTDSSGQVWAQAYAISSGVSGGSGATVSTSDPDYTAPDGVSTITLTGAYQIVHANNGGDVIVSSNSGNALYGGSGADIFDMGRGADWAAGGGGSDIFAFAGIPWAAGGIIDFSASDVLDLSGLMATTQDTGKDGFADGYLKLSDDSAGDAQVWARYATSGPDSTWWLVTTLYGTPAANLDGHKNLVADADAVTTSASDYVAPDYVTAITLTGSQQIIDASDTARVTINSNDSGNILIGSTASGASSVGGSGYDTFNLGRGGDWVTGASPGSNIFAYAAIPWAGGHITNFHLYDTVDLSGLMATTQDTGADGFADGYLMLSDDSAGDAQLWARYATSGPDSGWWLVTSFDKVQSSMLVAADNAVTLSPGASFVTTSASHYVAPSFAAIITLTGSHQIVDASATHGLTINSNDSGNALYGSPGADVFHLGRGGDWVQGGGGADTFIYPGVPWAGGGITDFNGAEGDRIDVTGLLANAGFTGGDPFAEGYLRYTSDGSGNAQLWADYNQPGADGWWLVATLDGVSSSSLHYANGLIT